MICNASLMSGILMSFIRLRDAKNDIGMAMNTPNVVASNAMKTV